jgi:hypothetical protein
MSTKLPVVLAGGFVILALALVGLLAWARSRPAPQEERADSPIPAIDAAPDTETATFAMG